MMELGNKNFTLNMFTKSSIMLVVTINKAIRARVIKKIIIIFWHFIATTMPKLQLRGRIL